MTWLPCPGPSEDTVSLPSPTTPLTRVSHPFTRQKETSQPAAVCPAEQSTSLPVCRGVMSILSVYESEKYVESLQPLPLDQVGSKQSATTASPLCAKAHNSPLACLPQPHSAAHSVCALSYGVCRWLVQSEYVQRLNQQAHLDALTHHDEYIVDCVLLHNRLPTLIHHLLTLEAYAHHVTPHVLPRLAANSANRASASMRLYLVLYQQPVLCNLLECLLYHSSLLTHSDESLVELVDYCVRKVRLLCGWTHDDGDSDDAEEEGEEARMSRQMRQLDFSSAACCLVILRYITDRLADLPLALVNRLIHTHDLLLTVIPLLHSKPFTRRRTTAQHNKPTTKATTPASRTTTEKYVDQQWTAVAAADLTLMTKLEGQLWLLVYNLLLSPSVRSAYSYNTHRQQAVLSLRPLLTPTVMEQLTVLENVRRCVEELSIMTPPEPSNRDAMAVVEQLPEIRDSILRGQDFAAIAEAFLSDCYSASSAASVQSLAESLLAGAGLAGGVPVCAMCGCEADKRCSLCAEVWYCGRECQVAAWKTHKPHCEERREERRRKEDERKRRDEQANAEREKERQDEEAERETNSRRWGKTGGSGGSLQRVLIEEMDA